ncbi:MAG: DUF1178 family protein [Pseudazoarcus pumilus]|nr:DUF1178 family protein [Pseudazoarcus pumilus]
MIVYNLCCDRQHLFEGWFANADAFADQRSRGLVECPQCGSTHIERRPSAPYVNTAAARGEPAAPQPPVDPAQIIAALRQAARSAEDVGEQFPLEARRIHYGEAEARNIRGRASGDDLGELLEEGILVLPVPEEPPLQ